MYSLQHLLLLNFRMRVLVGGFGIFATFALCGGLLEAQGAEEGLLAEVRPSNAVVSGVSLGSANITSVASSSAVASSKEKTTEEILNTPLQGMLSLALINRIEELPKEKMDVSAGQVTTGPIVEGDEGPRPGELARQLADHWKELLVTLVAHSEKLALSAAEGKVEEMLSVSEKIGQAMVVQEGIDMKDFTAPSMEARLQTTEALVAKYVRDVMISRRNEEWWQNWRDAWNRGVTRIPQDLVGQWSVAEDSGINFAQATIADRRCTLIWQERAGGKIQKIDIDVMRATEGKLFRDERDAGLRYWLEQKTEHEPILTFDVPGRKADTVLKLRLRPDW